MTPERLDEICKLVTPLSEIFGPAGCTHEEMVMVLAFYLSAELLDCEDIVFAIHLNQLFKWAMDSRIQIQEGKSPFRRVVDPGSESVN